MIGKKNIIKGNRIGLKSLIVSRKTNFASNLGAKNLQPKTYVTSKENLNYHISNLMDIIDIDTLDKIGERLRSPDRFYIESLLHHSELQKNKYNSLKHPENKQKYKDNLQKLYKE